MLVEAGGLSQHNLQEALKAQLIYGGKLGTILIELGFVTQEFLTSLLSQQSGLPPAPIDALENVKPEVLSIVPRELAERYTMVPFLMEKRRLHVAIKDPGNLSLVDEVSFATGLGVTPFVAPELLIWSLLDRYYQIARPDRYIRISEDPAMMITTTASGEPLETPPPPRAEPSATPEGSRDDLTLETGGEEIIELDRPVEEAAPPPPVSKPAPPVSKPAPPPPAPAAPPAPSAAAGEEGALTLSQVVRKLMTFKARDEILKLVFQFGAAYFENLAIFMLRADGYHLHVAQGSHDFQVRSYTLTEGVTPQSFGNCFGRAGFHLGPMAPRSEGEALLAWLGLPNDESIFMVPLVSNQKAGAILLAAGPVEGSFSNEDLRIFQMFMEKCSLGIQLLSVKQRLMVLPAEMA